MTELFNLYDREGSGRLSLDAFERALQSTWEDMPSSQEVLSDFDSADTGSKGYITLQDFINWLQKTMWVDFQDLAKGASHGYSKYLSKVRINRREGMLGFVTDKTLVEISAKSAKKMGRSRNRRPNFVNEFAAQQARSSRRSALSIADRVSGTLNRPIGPVWRPRVCSSPPRSQSASPLIASSSSPSSPLLANRRNTRPVTSAMSRLTSAESRMSRTSSQARPFSPLHSGL